MSVFSILHPIRRTSRTSRVAVTTTVFKNPIITIVCSVLQMGQGMLMGMVIAACLVIGFVVYVEEKG